MELLHLSLNLIPFKLMYPGKKKIEFRGNGEWIAKRLIGKSYTHVKFTNGYGANRLWFIAEFKGFVRSKNSYCKTYLVDGVSLVVFVEPGDYLIVLGDVVQVGNIDKIAA